MTTETWPTLFLRTVNDRPDRTGEKRAPSESAEEQETEGERYIRCRRCRQEIAKPSDRVTKDGAHRHTFANPHGIVYEIGCFREVRQCGFAGRSSSEFTWFAGYSWRILFCGVCLSHLGWVFESPGRSSFYGLIVSQIEEPD